MTVKSGATTIDTYRYDGGNRRVQKIASSTRDYYYSNQWQILEEQVSTPAQARLSRAPICLGRSLSGRPHLAGSSHLADQKLEHLPIDE